MFSDSPVETDGFAVPPEIERSKDESGSQTAPQSSDEKETQTIVVRDISNQTDGSSPATKDAPEYDSEKLASFLNRIYPELLEELDRGEWCRGNPHENDLKYDDEPVINLHIIESKKCQGKGVGCLSWNSTGLSLAISYCEPFHKSWCTHDGQIHVYCINTNEFTNFPPVHVLNTDSCPKCISFHPVKPSLLLAGLYNGEVIVWDLKEDEPATFRIQDDGWPKHSEAITCVSWLSDGMDFVTSGRDGLVIFWKIFLKEVEVSKRFFISSEYCNPGRSLKNDHAEILSLSFWQDSKDFILATGGGNILHCSSESKEISLKPGFSDPVLMKYESHSGIITCLKCSTDNMFASCGTDSEIHVYSSREKIPIYIIHCESPLLGIEWVENNPGIVACWGSSPNVYFYNVNTKEKLDPCSIHLANLDSEIISGKLNKQRRGMMAVGTVSGETSVWMIPRLSMY